MTSFTKEVLAVVRKIPRGKTISYKKVAWCAGSPRAYRAVGNIMNRCGGMEHGIPCHRVVKSDGTPGGYAWGTKKKIALLKKEGAIKK
ncbi:MAG: MGMT family protein [bacterium]|nr:MGMT family protein [bacterium]